MTAPACTTALGSLRRYRGEHAAHVHPHAQLLFGLGGCLELEVDGRAARVDATTGLVLPAGTWHGFEAPGGAEVWVIDAPDALAPRRFRTFALPAGWSPAMPAAQLLQHAAQAPRTVARRRVEPARLAGAVDAALHEDWPADRMAALFALSVPRFHARWKALTGRSPQAWLRERRLDAAEAALRAGRGAEAVALQVGYHSASALIAALRRERGVGARALRRR